MITRVGRFAARVCERSTRGLDNCQRRAVRRNCTRVAGKVLERLNDRSVLRVSGDETSDFLQGLITNDMKHLEEGAPNVYTLFLNVKGRVLYDAIVYKSEESSSYYVECDARIAESLRRHLQLYRVKRKIDVEHVGDRLHVWALFDPARCLDGGGAAATDENGGRGPAGMIFPCGTLSSKTSKFIGDVMIHEDPRLPELGLRILAESRIGRREIVKHVDADVVVPASGSADDYRAFRYKLGVGEGVRDLPPGQALPLEINCDYLHGVSFHKGCYIGQELTARTHHTGVVRKRLMPLTLDDAVATSDKPLAYDEKVLDQSGKVVGKFRGHVDRRGLGLMRINESLNARQLSVSGVSVRVIKPAWWLQESQGETISVKDTK